MIRPEPLKKTDPYGPWSCRGIDIWDAICAACDGETERLRAVLERDANLYRAEYWYAQPILFAVREGHAEAVRALLEAGADPSWSDGLHDDLIVTARDRGFSVIAEILEEARATREATPTPGAPKTDGAPIHAAVASGEVAAMESALEAAPESVHALDPVGRTPLHHAVATGSAAAVELLLARGADPNWPEGPEAPRGKALHTAARMGDRVLVERLLTGGADPNAEIDSSGSATWAAATPELRELLIAGGGRLDPAYLIWLDEDDAAIELVRADPSSASSNCGGAFATACKLGKRDVVARLIEAGARVPATVTECRSYLWHDPESLDMLLAAGMDPDLPSWERATPLHDLCSRDGRGRPYPHRVRCAETFLDAGADITARDEHYRSTPLAWAARTDLIDMVELLLDRGAPVSLADDEPWATPLAWAERRGHREVARRLRAAIGTERG
ncbi:MAG: ankyrin repeat domain-containing protein [Gemmatimonadetes bacterium]|nr:ankyrin repeat domain-containing protein [Gemmatimonadota bacterium]